ncbi:uncharacterized protein C8Q71DRAFT_598732 [Rhodofomes roseus]|uniref:F-box domain-containing protein n=1 Tax=Rhodofomes roseus TaxID=34475 RepID=A0ABQ8KHR7_9APHY|nr:uncharacterized protein C8Q71DRAFT_598732 [Rhodofomes roseus]KAH9837368.1 hypothetical protein C8Q71DRAFT_598732 [Rhodofomes roseus]
MLPGSLSVSGDTDDSIPPLPTDLHCDVIDLIADLQDFEVRHFPMVEDDFLDPQKRRKYQWRTALISCAFVCKGWYHRSRHRLDKHVWLWSRRQVKILARRLRQGNNPRDVVRHVTILGTRFADDEEPAPYLGTFAAMLARQLPVLECLTLCNVSWQVGSMHPRCISYLAAFHSITRLELLRMSFQSVSQLARLLSALPSIRAVSCQTVSCNEVGIPLPFPQVALNRSLREVAVEWTAHPIVFFLAYLGTVAPVESLTITFVGPTFVTPSGLGWPCQRLLDAYAGSLKKLKYLLDPDTTRHGAVPGAQTLPSHLDLSHLTKLSTIVIGHLFPSTVDYCWIPSLLSKVTSPVMARVHIILRPRVDNINGFMGGLLDSMEYGRALRLIDSVLSREQYARIPKQGVVFEIKVPDTMRAEMKDAMALRGNWEQFVKWKMPRSDSRGIVHCIEYVSPSL